MMAFPFQQRTASRLAAALLLGLLISAGSLSAQEQRFASMKDAMQALAENIQTNLQAQGVSALNVKPFDGPSGASASSRIVQAITEQLSAMKPSMQVAQAAGWSVTGSYFVDQSDLSGKAEIYIESTLKNPRGLRHATLVTPIITNDSETLTLFGVTGNLPTQTTPSEQAAGKTLAEVRADAIIKAIDQPRAAVAGSQVRASADSPYAVEILIDRQALPAELEKNEFGETAFVNIPPQAIYAIRLINDSDEDVGVTLTIDGVNTLHFSKNPEFQKLGKWVIGKRSSGVITGWHSEGTTARSFRVTEYGESAAALLGATRDIGTITALFCAAFEGAVPPSEQGVKGDAQQATGFGPEVQQRLTAVKRSFGLERAAVSVRYNKPDDLPPPEPAIVLK